MKSRKWGLTLSYGYFILNTIVGIFLSSFVVRVIGKTDYGIYQSVGAFVSYLTLLEFGTGRILSRNISLLKKDGTDEGEIKKNISTVLCLNAILTVMILGAAVCFWLLIDVLYKNSMTPDQILIAKRLFVFPIITLIVSFLQQSFNGIILGYENYTFEKLLSFIKLILRASIIVLALTINPNIFVFVIIETSLNVVAFLATVLYAKFKMRVPISLFDFDNSIFKLILPLCLAMLLQSVVTTMNGTLDKFLISIMLTPEDVTVYSVAMTIFSMYSTVACLPMSLYMPKVASDIKSGLTGHALTETLVEPCRINIIITGAIAAGFTVAGKQFIQILYGDDFYTAWICALIVIFPTFLNTANDVVINVLDVLRKRHIRSIILMGTTFLNFVLTIWGIKMIGMIGAALATGIATLLQVIILNYYYQKYIKLDVIFMFAKGMQGVLPCLAIALCFSLPFMWIRNIYLSFVLCCVVFAVLFLLLFYRFGANAIEKEYFEKSISKLCNRKG